MYIYMCDSPLGEKKKSKSYKKSIFDKAKESASGSSSLSSTSSTTSSSSSTTESGHQVDFKHHVWWSIPTPELIKGDILFEMESGKYLMAVDNGTLTSGILHDPEDPEAPSPQEVFTIVSPAPGQVAIRSGYGRYITATSDGKVHAQTEAVGTREIWEVVPVTGEDGLFAFRNTFTNKFLSAGLNGGISAGSESITPQEMFLLRSNRPYQESVKKRTASGVEESEISQISPDDVASLSNFATSVSKKFQAVAVRHPSKATFDENALHELKKARIEGDIHEKLLDHRAKIKGDKYCK